MGEKRHCLVLALSLPNVRVKGTRQESHTHTHTHTHRAQAHLYDSSNPPPDRPKGKETLVLINPGNKECRGHDPKRARLARCRSEALVNKT